MPRIFAGLVTIIPMRLEEWTSGIPLYPTQQNISQLMYLTISIVTVSTACALAFRSASTRQHLLSALCVGGVLIVFTGVLDLAGLGPYLDMFRTAQYAYSTDVEIADVKRVVGLMPEASAYGSLAVSFLSAIYFFRRAIALRGCGGGPLPRRAADALCLAFHVLRGLCRSGCLRLRGCR